MGRKGVTLVELIVVMVIIAIAAALTVPGLGVWLPQYRLRSAARDIVSTMRTAQMKAVSSNTEYRVSFDVNNKTYVIQYQTTAGMVNEGSAQGLPTGIQFTQAIFSGDVAYAVFNPNSTSSAGRVTVRNPKGSTKSVVLLGATGRVRIE